MSIIGPGSLGAINLAGSVAGAQRNSADADRVQEGAAERKLNSDLQALAAKSLDDVGQADESHDRDADGRLPFGYGERAPSADEDEFDPAASSPLSSRPPARDADGIRGRLLDVEG